jgi:two-component system repressor protein LuxO
VEREAIEEAIRLCGGNVPKAAGFLGVSPSTLYRKRVAWGGGVQAVGD